MQPLSTPKSSTKLLKESSHGTHTHTLIIGMDVMRVPSKLSLYCHLQYFEYYFGFEQIFVNIRNRIRKMINYFV